MLATPAQEKEMYTSHGPLVCKDIRERIIKFCKSIQGMHHDCLHAQYLAERLEKEEKIFSTQKFASFYTKLSELLRESLKEVSQDHRGLYSGLQFRQLYLVNRYDKIDRKRSRMIGIQLLFPITPQIGISLHICKQKKGYVVLRLNKLSKTEIVAHELGLSSPVNFPDGLFEWPPVEVVSLKEARTPPVISMQEIQLRNLKIPLGEAIEFIQKYNKK